MGQADPPLNPAGTPACDRPMFLNRAGSSDRMVSVPSVKPLAAFLGDLRSLPPGEFRTSRVMPLIDGVFLPPEDIEPFLSWDLSHYTRNLIHRDEVFEALAVCWDVGQVSAIHNHSGEEGWILVQRGALEVVNYRLVRCDMTPRGTAIQPTPCRSGCHSLLEECSRETVCAGGAATEGGDSYRIHQVANPAVRGERAVSIHIYSRPLESCVVYDRQNERCRRVSLAYDTVPASARPGM